MDHGLRQVLGIIVERLVLSDEIKDIDLNAPASETGNEISAARAQAQQRELAAADALAQPFVDGILAASAARAQGQDGVTFDDRVPAENTMADALIRYLVSFDLAESHTAETEPLHYTYRVVIDWDALGNVARDGGVDLDAAIAAATRS